MRLNTIGKMSQRLQQSPEAIERSIDRLQIEPELTLNGLQYFSVADETRIRENIIAECEDAAWAGPSVNDPQT